MPKTKNVTDMVPRKIQQLFTTAAIIAFALNAAFWLLLLNRVYGQGFRISQFSVVALSEILLPVLLFVVALALVRVGSSRTSNLFIASLLAFTGVLIQRLVDLLSITTLHAVTQLAFRMDVEPIVSSLIGPVVTLIIYAGLLLYILKRKDHFAAARMSLLLFLWVALIFFVATALASLTMVEIGGASKVASLPFTLMQFTQIALPLAFVAVAYLGVPKTAPLRDRASLLIVIAAIGMIIFQATLSLSMIIQQFAGNSGVMNHDPILLAGIFSFLVFAGSIVLYKVYDRRNH